MEMTHLQDLYVDELKDLLHAENQIIKALPKMAKNAASPELASAFTQHLEETKEQVRRLEQIFEKMGMPARGKKCKGMEGIIEEGNDFMKEAEDDDVRDAAMISAAQKVEHYEIASYGCARTYAKLLGDDQAARLLQETLDEEELTDRKLTELAERSINIEAASGDA